MTTEELRQKMMSRIDALLASWLLVRGEDRRLLSAPRGYAADMSDSELARLMTFMVKERVGGEEVTT